MPWPKSIARAALPKLSGVFAVGTPATIWKLMSGFICCVVITTGAGLTGVPTSWRETCTVFGARKVTMYCLRSSTACCRYRRSSMKHWLYDDVARAAFSAGCSVTKLKLSAVSKMATTATASSMEKPRALCDTIPSFLGRFEDGPRCFREVIPFSTADFSAPLRVGNDDSMQCEKARPARCSAASHLYCVHPRDTSTERQSTTVHWHAEGLP